MHITYRCDENPRLDVRPNLGCAQEDSPGETTGQFGDSPKSGSGAFQWQRIAQPSFTATATTRKLHANTARASSGMRPGALRAIPQFVTRTKSLRMRAN